MTKANDYFEIEVLVKGTNKMRERSGHLPC